MLLSLKLQKTWASTPLCRCAPINIGAICVCDTVARNDFTTQRFHSVLMLEASSVDFTIPVHLPSFWHVLSHPQKYGIQIKGCTGFVAVAKEIQKREKKIPKRIESAEY
eukprot:Phypoly_transcript_22036.p1 GENE.Phypoly_transcript_22036~~Phypoly_transcript_22036.p1  ORF type:complete len:109 (+),score=14.42 Phypoly_transcript_22036:142-468(+)